MTAFVDILPRRIPETLQDDNNLRKYLEVAGELFDEFYATIEEFKTYKDPAKVAAERLHLLAAEFAMQFPANLNEELQRDILRDLEAIFQKSGTIDIVNWIFRLIGWDVEVEYAWILNPEKYDPNIKEVFGLDDYGKEQTPYIPTDFFRRDYRSFLLGHDIVYENGTYFKGRKFFDLEDTFHKNEIVGQYYDPRTKTRTADKVLATPYLFINVSEETYNIFISPYEDPETGEIYEYTELEFFRVVENIFNFFLFDEMRATHTRVVIIVTPQILEDEAVIEDEFEETWTSSPLEENEIGVYGDKEESIIKHQILVGSDFLAGAPPSPFSKDMVMSAVAYRSLITNETPPRNIVDAEERNYVIAREENIPVARCGADTFKFFTPHEEPFPFRRIFLSEQTTATLIGTPVEGAPYEDEDESLTLNFDVLTQTYGMVSETQSQDIIVRNPTNISSPCFPSDTVPSDAYVIGEMVGSEFDKNLLFSMDLDISDTIQVDSSNKTFIYDHDLIVYYKENNMGADWNVLIENPTVETLNTITTANTLALVFSSPIPYDFILDVEYQAQEHWENRETYNIYEHG